MNKYLTQKNYLIAVTASAFIVSKVIKTVIKKSYGKYRGEEPPENPEQTNASLSEVLIFSLGTALIGATAKIMVRKLLAKKWRDHGGELPAHLK